MEDFIRAQEIDTARKHITIDNTRHLSKRDSLRHEVEFREDGCYVFHLNVGNIGWTARQGRWMCAEKVKQLML